VLNHFRRETVEAVLGWVANREGAATWRGL